jgi:hypothetical protein
MVSLGDSAINVCFANTLGPTKDPYGPIWVHIGPILGPCWVHFGAFGYMFDIFLAHDGSIEGQTMALDKNIERDTWRLVNQREPAILYDKMPIMYS